VLALEFGKPRDQPAHCESRQSRYPKQRRGRHGLAQALTHGREAIEGVADLGEQVRPHLCRYRVPAGAQEQPGPEPILQQAYLPANRAVGDVELFCGAREAAEPGGGFEGFDRI
jgi:hypothetical protein